MPVTLKQVSDQIKLITQDSTYDVYITEYVNDVCNELCGEILFSELESSDTVTTSVGYDYVSLPADYHRGLYAVYENSAKQRIPVLSHNVLFERFGYAPDTAGDISAVAVAGKKLYYRYIPTSASVLALKYYRTPEVLSDDTDVLDFLTSDEEPAGKWAVIHGVCKKIFDQIEDGIDGRKANTQLHEARYENEKLKLLKRSRHDMLIAPSVPNPI